MSADGPAQDKRLENLSPAQRALLEQRLLKRRTDVARRNAIPARELHSPCELSYSQELLWLLSQVFDDAVAYNAPGTHRIEGPLDLELLRLSYDALVARHEILRTTYTVIDGHPMQVIGDPEPTRLNVVDLRELPAAEREAEAHRVLAEESSFRFDLVHGPVFRVTVIRMRDDDHIMMLNVHHVATDGYSRAALYRDLTVFYDALASGAEPVLPELAIQYADYAVWHRRWLDGGIADKQLEYWKQQLAGAPSRLDLPTDYPRPPVRSYLGDHMSGMLDIPTREGVREAGRRNGGTMFTSLLALFATLLSRYSGQDDVVIGTPFAGRNRTELESMVGYFINPLALRIDLSGDPTFDELVVRARDTTQAAFANADLPYEMVVRATNPERDLSQTPVFQAMIVYHNPAWENARPKFEPRGFRSQEVSHEKGWSKFDVLLGVSERQNGMNTTWEYSTELFAPATVSRMREHLMALARSVAAGSDRPLSRLSMLSAAERTQVLVDWNRGGAEPPRQDSIKELFEAQAARTPQAEAVVFESERLTYAELNARANRIAAELRERGAGPGSVVGIMMEKSLELVPAVLGVLKAGAAYLPMDPGYPRERLELMLEDVAPALLLTHHRLASPPPPSPAASVFVDDLLAAGGVEENPPTVSGPDDLAYVIYTSGSTGVPKGAMITLGGLAGTFHAYRTEYRLAELRAHAQMASFSFDVFSGDLIRALLTGAKVVICPIDVVLDPARLYGLWEREGVDAVELVPATATLLFEYAERENKRLDFMRFIAIGGEAWRTDRYLQFKRLCGPDTRLVNSYGLTEATMDSTYFEPAPGQALVPGRFMPIGRPLPGTEVYVLGGGLEPQPIGLAGELCIGGHGVSRGYLNRPELTAERFVENPFRPGERMYRTGDLVRWTADGVIEFVGRGDRQLKIRGFRVEPGEVESILERRDDVRVATVVDREDPRGERHLVAYLEPTAAAPQAADLRSYLAEHLPAYMVPSAYVALESLPRTPTGKIDRRNLPAPEWDGGAAGDDFVAPRTPTEQRIVEIWTEILSVTEIGAGDNFFALGGHSLLAMRVMTRIQDSFDVALPMRALFDSPTVGELAGAVDAAVRERAAAGEPAPGNGQGPAPVVTPALAPIQRSRLRAGGGRP